MHYVDNINKTPEVLERKILGGGKRPGKKYHYVFVYPVPFTRVWGVGAAGDWAVETFTVVPLLCFSVSSSSLRIKLDFK